MIINFVRLQTGLGQAANIVAFPGVGSGGATVTKKVVGWTGRRIKREEFERRLKEQRDNTFGRRRWRELQELEQAELAASKLAIETKSKAQRNALERAAKAARGVVEEAREARALPEPEITALAFALQAASGAARIKESLDASKRAQALAATAMLVIRQAEDDAQEEEEAIELLSLLS